MKRPALLDSSYLIDLERETAKAEIGPARTFLSSLRGRPLVVSVISVEERVGGPTSRREVAEREGFEPVRAERQRREARRA